MLCDGAAGVAEMAQFRALLSGTEGEANCRFWLDIQLLRQRLINGQLRERDLPPIIDRVRRFHISDNTHFSLSRKVKTKLAKELCNLRPTRRKSVRCSAHARHIRALCEAQREVAVSLREYWYKLLHNKCNSPLCGVELGKKTTDRESLPAIVADSNTTLTCVKSDKAVLKLPHITNGGNYTDINLLPTEKLSRLASLELNPLFSPSTTALFAHSHLSLSTPSLETVEGDLCHLNPFLTGSLRADFLAGHPLLSHLSHKSHKAHFSHISRRNSEIAAINRLLFWWSAELLLTRDEIKRFRNRRSLGATMRGSPCYSSCINELVPTASDPKELVQLFIKEGSPHEIELPSQTRDELVRLLPRGLGQSLLVSAQESAAQVRPHCGGLQIEQCSVVSDFILFFSETCCVVERVSSP